ncbi:MULTISPECIES: DUF4328 domain-containing protein [unclassified Streptomyces]|uniref:DUF4328 domain-containing protein n=1 Tax=unclassified Streptomyces TaxID=2593676 RepID=UPI002E291975|nr:DUF4328 domain-containing protein [Streptomyces sp. NBC_00273]
MSAVPVGPPPPSPYVAPLVKAVRPRPPVGLAIALTALFALVIGFDVFAAYVDWNSRSILERLLADSAAVSDAELDQADRLAARAGMFQGQVAIVTGIVFIIWFHRVRTNAEAFAPGADKLPRGWAIGAWFIPLANLVLPYRIAVTTWMSSTPFGADGQRPWFRLTLVNLWWGTFVLSKVLGWYGGRSYASAETTEAVRNAATTMLAGDVLDIVAAVLALLFVRRLTAMQHARAARGPVVAAV